MDRSLGHQYTEALSAYVKNDVTKQTKFSFSTTTNFGAEVKDCYRSLNRTKSPSVSLGSACFFTLSCGKSPRRISLRREAWSSLFFKEVLASRQDRHKQSTDPPPKILVIARRTAVPRHDGIASFYQGGAGFVVSFCFVMPVSPAMALRW